MKKLKKYILLSLSVIALASCDEDSFLTQINPNAISTDTFWETEGQFNTALTTVYGALQFQGVSGALIQHEMMLGDIAGTESWYRPAAFRNLTYNDNTYYLVDRWNELYIGIFRANQVIENIQDADISVAAKSSIEAQARCLRAFYYFQLVHSYGQAVIHTEVAKTAEDLSKPLSSIEEVTNQVIKPDLEFAAARLPLVWSEGSSRVTSGTAKSLLGKVYLYNQEWSEAASQFKTVIDSGVYSLVSDLADNFTDTNEHNSESIFEVSFSSELNPGVNGAIVDDTDNETGAEASALARALGQINYGGYNTVLTSYFLHELMVYDEVDSTNPINDGNVHSRRLSASIAPKNFEGEYYGRENDNVKGWGFGQSAYVKKHTNWYHLDAEDGNSRSGINFRHIRYADVLLMYAEAVIEESGDFATAITYIDMVRSRAGVKTLQQYMDENAGQFPQLHVSTQVHGAQPMVTADAVTVMKHIRRVERPLELCFEGHRWKDMVRWGIVDEVYTELRLDEIWREANKAMIFDTPPLYIVERIRPDFFLSEQNYIPEQHNYFPIPSGEVQTNEEL